MNYNKIKYILFAGVLLTLNACSGFLDEVDKDKLIPEKTDHYAALLLWEFNAEFPIFSYIDYMTDNMTEVASATSEQKEAIKSCYTWQREIELDEEGDRLYNNDAWEDIYEDIAIVNYIIALIDEADGTQDEKDYVKGEAYFVRAYSYFNLLNLYGIPYNSESATTDLGVPIRTDLAVESTYSRNTVAECYAQIESDLIYASQLIEGSELEKSIWHPSVYACDLLMSRIKLYQEQWEEAISYATEVIDNNSLSRLSADNAFISDDNSEILYSFYTESPLFNLYSSGTTFRTFAYCTSDDFYDLYDTLDVRKEAFFTIQTSGTKEYVHTLKYTTGTYTELGFANFRVAEAYLNRAEALAHLNRASEGLTDVQALLEKRYTNTAGIVYPTGDEEIMDFILTERRKELCFEEHHRWFDLRRMDNQPEIQHGITLVTSEGTAYGTEVYTLFADDPNYTLPIPLDERDNNPQIRNNERYDKLPESTDIINL